MRLEAHLPFYISLFILVLPSVTAIEGKNLLCKEACNQTYGAVKESINLGSITDSCQRGCRFYTIVEILRKDSGRKDTLKTCYDNCQDAYLGRYQESEACHTGCANQQRFQEDKSKKYPARPSLLKPNGIARKNEGLPSGMYPLMLMKTLMGNIAGPSSLSFVTVEDGEGHTGHMVVVRTRPQVDVDFKHLKSRQFEDAPERPFIKSSEYQGSELNTAELSTSDHFAGSESDRDDWLSYLAQRTGAPRLFLCVLLLLSALSMIWLCMSAVVTAPNQHVKLSIKSDDLEYVRSLPEQKGLLGVYPQSAVEARPLPSKVKSVKL